MTKRTTKTSSAGIVKPEPLFIGIDVGDKKSYYCAKTSGGAIVEEGQLVTKCGNMKAGLERFVGAKVLIEVGTHAHWIKDEIEAAGLSCKVCDAKSASFSNQHGRKTDRRDAQMLAELLRTNSSLVKTITLCRREVQLAMTTLRVRDAVVACRTKLINSVRTSVKPYGVRLRQTSSRAFGATYPTVPADLQEVLSSAYAAIGALNHAIDTYDKKVEKLAANRPQVEILSQVHGVGTLTGLAVALAIFDKDRFTSARTVGAYFGLVPHERSSGSVQPEMRISKQGNGMVRRLLVQSAHYILGPLNKKDSDLRRFGLARMSGGGKVAKKKAVVAVARKIACLLVRLWKTGEVYDPLRNTRAREEREAALTAEIASVS